MAKKYTYTETKMIRDIARVMAETQGPFTKKKLAELLKDAYPELGYQELKNELAMAFLTDKHCNKRFKVVRTGVWELNVNDGQEECFAAKHCLHSLYG